jgi:hypothetical protein
LGMERQGRQPFVALAEAAGAVWATDGPPGGRIARADRRGRGGHSARMAPEDPREVIAVYQKCVAEFVQRFGGFVAK